MRYERPKRPVRHYVGCAGMAALAVMTLLWSFRDSRDTGAGRLPAQLASEIVGTDSTEDYGTLLPPKLIVDTQLVDQGTGKCIAVYLPHHVGTGKEGFRICGGPNMPRAKRYVLAGTTFEQITLVPELFVGK